MIGTAPIAPVAQTLQRGFAIGGDMPTAGVAGGKAQLRKFARRGDGHPADDFASLFAGQIGKGVELLLGQSHAYVLEFERGRRPYSRYRGVGMAPRRACMSGRLIGLAPPVERGSPRPLPGAEGTGRISLDMASP